MGQRSPAPRVRVGLGPQLSHPTAIPDGLVLSFLCHKMWRLDHVITTLSSNSKVIKTLKLKEKLLPKPREPSCSQKHLSSNPVASLLPDTFPPRLAMHVWTVYFNCWKEIPAAGPDRQRSPAAREQCSWLRLTSPRRARSSCQIWTKITKEKGLPG